LPYAADIAASCDAFVAFAVKMTSYDDADVAADYAADDYADAATMPMIISRCCALFATVFFRYFLDYAFFAFSLFLLAFAID